MLNCPQYIALLMRCSQFDHQKNSITQAGGLIIYQEVYNFRGWAANRIPF